MILSSFVIILPFSFSPYTRLIFSDILLPIVIGHSYYKKVFWIKGFSSLDIIDYYTSYNIPACDIEPLTIEELFIGNLYEEINYLNISNDIINNKKKEIFDLLYFMK